MKLQKFLIIALTMILTACSVNSGQVPMDPPPSMDDPCTGTWLPFGATVTLAQEDDYTLTFQSKAGSISGKGSFALMILAVKDGPTFPLSGSEISNDKIATLKWGNVAIVKIARCSGFLFYVSEFHPENLTPPGDPKCVGDLRERLKPSPLIDKRQISEKPELYLVQVPDGTIFLAEATPEGLLKKAGASYPANGTSVFFREKTTLGPVAVELKNCGPGGIYFRLLSK